MFLPIIDFFLGGEREMPGVYSKEGICGYFAKGFQLGDMASRVILSFF